MTDQHSERRHLSGDEREALDIRCKVCDKPYRNEAPLLVWGERDGKQGMFAPTPDEADAFWMPGCRHRPPQPYVVGQEVTDVS